MDAEEARTFSMALRSADYDHDEAGHHEGTRTSQEGNAHEEASEFALSSQVYPESDTVLPSADTSNVAPLFPSVHRTWETLEEDVKAYAKATNQLYVVRTTTSVKRRNIRIAEVGIPVDFGSDDEEHKDGEGNDRLLIPEHWQWYSKTLMCTHGWKDRHRGKGKRAMATVRSTGCPVKMCCTLQYHSDAVTDTCDGWQVVVTKQVRTHNHPLSKELYLFYTENRRIYDPELLALVGGFDSNRVAIEMLDAFEDGEMDAGDVIHSAARRRTHPNELPGMTPKAFSSWDSFHKALIEYSIATQQQFRIRSTISAPAKNTKLLEQCAKTGKSREEVTSQLVPEEMKWHSKLLICGYGWKRRSRSKMSQHKRRGAPNNEWKETINACPAMIMARVQRDVNDNWRVTIHRQVVDHNHPLVALDVAAVEQDDQQRQEEEQALLGTQTANEEDQVHDDVGSASHDEDLLRQLSELRPPPTDASTNPEAGQTGTQSDFDLSLSSHGYESAVPPPPPPHPHVSVVAEVVVRVPKLLAVHDSWEAFHFCLQQYSEATYQSYRTRTTTSIKGRNSKIRDLPVDNDWDGVVHPLAEAAKRIPEEFKWYSKTLTCTHGWKERHRGSGKRAIHVVRSTLCPVKICATLQYVSAVDSASQREPGWRVVVTKHVVDHNHNLSRELYQHYCENRRIYDPELLAIDQLSASTVLVPHAQGPVDDAISAAMTALVDVQQHTFIAQSSADSAAVFDQHEAFATHQALPDTGYVPSNPVLTSQQERNLGYTDGDGMALMSYTPIMAPAALMMQHIGTTTQQAFAQANLFGSGQLSSGNTQVLPVSLMPNPVCPLHRNAVSSSVQPSSREENSGCTCQRLRLQQRLPIPERYRTRDPPSQSTQVSKKPRREVRSINAFGQEVSPADVLGSISTISQVWSPSNLLQANALTEANGANVWRAPRLKRRHESWASFTQYLEEYSTATYQLYRIRTTSSVHARNTRISRQQQHEPDGNGLDHEDDNDEMEDDLTRGQPPQLVPECHEWYSKTYVCTHGWKTRNRGKGQRVSHNLRSTACPVKLCVTLQRDPHDASQWNVVITKHLFDHNHEISPSTFENYSVNRRIKDPELLAQAEQMWRQGQPRRKVFEFLKEATHSRIMMKDVHNLVQRWQQRPQQSSEPIDPGLLNPPHATDDPQAAGDDCSIDGLIV